MIAKKEIERMPVEHATGRGNDRWIGRIRMAGEALVMDVYDARRIMCPPKETKEVEISFRWVCDREKYYTYIFKSSKWTTQGMYWAMHGYSGYCSDVDIRLDKKSKEIAEEFLGNYLEGTWKYQKGAVNRLFQMEDDIRQEKREKQWQQRIDRIEARQKRRKPLPKDWNQWLQNHVFKKEHYLFYDAKKRKGGTCAHCGSVVKLDGTQKHNGTGVCPSCKSKVVFKALGRAKSVIDTKQAIYLQKTEEGFLTRYIKVKKSSSIHGESYNSYDVVLGTWNGKKTWYDYCMISGLNGDVYWSDSKPLNMNSWKATGFLYTRNVRQTLKNTPWKYAPLTEWMKKKGSEIPFCDFMVKYQTSPFLEFFIKAGLYRLTEDYVQMHQTWVGKNPKEILGISKQRINRLIQMDGGSIALEWLQYEEKKNIKLPDEVIKYLQENNVGISRCKTVLDALGSAVRMVNYMKKQEVPPAELAVTWSDYLRMAKAEGMDITDDIVRFPKNLKQRHDELVKRSEQRADEKRLEKYADLDRQIAERIPEIKRYFWENEKYMIVPAAKCEELMIEGRTLHHCVGRDDNYMKKMADGISWILFLRKKEDLEKAYYTIEISLLDDHIIQFYSEFDRQPDRETIQKLLGTFQRNVRKRRSKEEMRAAG